MGPHRVVRLAKVPVKVGKGPEKRLWDSSRVSSTLMLAYDGGNVPVSRLPNTNLPKRSRKGSSGG